MSKKQQSNYDIVQFKVTYYPVDSYISLYDYNNDCWKVAISLDGVIKGYDNFVVGNKAPFIVETPFVIFDVVGFAGSSNDKDHCSGTEFEFRELGETHCIDGYEQQLLEIALKHLNKHPDLQPYVGNMFRRPKGKPILLKDYKDTLTIHFPTVWYCWSSFDEYTHEMDVELVFEGELDTYELVECLVKEDKDENS